MGVLNNHICFILTSNFKTNLHLIAIIHTYSKQYKNSCRFFSCNIITCMCIFSNKLHLILSNSLNYLNVVFLFQSFMRFFSLYDIHNIIYRNKFNFWPGRTSWLISRHPLLTRFPKNISFHDKFTLYWAY